MRARILFCFIILQLICTISFAQNVITDTFLRKDGVHLVPAFEQWQTATLFGLKKSKDKRPSAQPLLNLDACDRIKLYTSISFTNKKTEPYRFFRVLNDLEAHDSASYFEFIADIPPTYKCFFKGLYNVEDNKFDAALRLFDAVFTAGNADSLLMKDVPFWKEVTAKMLTEQQQHNLVFATYNLMENQRVDSTKLMNLLQQINLPQYVMHKYINLYNYYFRKNDYEAARSTYDSIIAYANGSKILKASLVKNKNSMQELLQGKQQFITAMKNDLYHYEMDYLYDHLEMWRKDTITDKAFVELAGFTLSKRNTSKFDSVFTRNLIDTSVNDQLSKFEALSFSRTKPDQAGRLFVIVKLGFSGEDAYKKYSSFLEKFKSKPISQSILYNRGTAEGEEYMLTKYFIAALFKVSDPLIKYELSLYALQDTEGNFYAVDTLF